jgi:ATP-dependent DNA helicase RecQ
VRAAFYDLEALGMASNDTALTAYLHVGVENSSKKRFERRPPQLESALIGLLREQHPTWAVANRRSCTCATPTSTCRTPATPAPCRSACASC